MSPVHLVGDPEPGVRRYAERGWRIARLAGVSDEPGFHDRIAAALDFPAHYGRNADALADCLRELAGPTALIWTGWAPLAVHRPRRWATLVTVLSERADRPGFELVLVQ